jgi:hypothetical protein
MAYRYCGSVRVRVELNTSTHPPSYRCRVKATTVHVRAPACGFGPGIAYDSALAYDATAHAALSFADDATDGAATEGCDFNDSGWAIRRKR